MDMVKTSYSSDRKAPLLFLKKRECVEKQAIGAIVSKVLLPGEPYMHGEVYPHMLYKVCGRVT